MYWSIKKRIYCGFALLVMIFVINGLVTVSTLRYTQKLSKYITEVADPSLRSLYELRKSLLESRMFATNWVFLRYDNESKSNLKEIQDTRFPALKSKLISLSESWNEKSMPDSLSKLLTGFEDLISDESPIMNSLQVFDDYDDLVKKLNAEEQLEHIVIPKSLRLMDLFKIILKQEQDARADQQGELENSRLFLQRLIVFFVVLFTAIAVFLSVYLGRIIIKPINDIKAIVNDLGKGVIRKLFVKEKNNEMGEMIKAVNNLSEKLAAMKTFALKVGKRDFSAHYELLSEEDTLGKALLAMRDGLRESEKELLRTHFQLETLFGKIDEVFFSMDMITYRLLQMSPACEKVYGYQSAEFFKNPMLWYELTLEEDRDIINSNDAMMRTGKAIQHESRIRHRDNSIHWIETKITPTLDDQGTLIRIDGVVSDITERKQTEELLRTRNTELVKSNMELDKFVYSVSHDLRAPLTSILGVINLAREDSDDAVIDSHLDLIESCVKRLDGFIRDILDYSYNSKYEVRNEEINFKELLNEVTGNLKYLNGARKIDVTLDVNEAKIFICDKERMSVVLNNLISNAARYQNPTVNNPLVGIRIDMTDTETNITVKDNGIGICKEFQPRIFDMFYRASQTSVGSGLGLYIVKEIVEKLNGNIEVESEPGIGTTFNIHLPAKAKMR